MCLRINPKCSFIPGIAMLKQVLGTVVVSVVVPGRHVVGQAVHSLKSVTMQSFLQGNKQGRKVSGREESGHL